MSLLFAMMMNIDKIFIDDFKDGSLQQLYLTGYMFEMAVLAKILAKFFEHHMYKLVGSYERKHIFRIICVCLILAACLMHEFLHVTNAIAFYLRPKQMCESCLIQFLFTCDD